ncbi:MAG: esterase [Alistipes sp.]|jgi:enterochelin esterase family protein|nr:esterase [Alistipes sp.]
MKKATILLSLALMVAGIASAQRRGPVVSPEVRDDCTVVFRYASASASEVLLDIQFLGAPLPMRKGDDGVWSVTVGPIVPDIYPYSFRVDGVTVMDPNNPDYFPNERHKGSLLDIPGPKLQTQAPQNVPHGAVNYDYYVSQSLGTTGRALVYTPPGYDANPDRRYPVFYLISGTTDTDETYFKVGRTNFILDNLIARGLAEPMIVVMPYGNPAYYFPAGAEQRRTANFNTDLLGDLMPHIDATYRTVADRKSRAIGGFSRGGNQALTAGLNNLDKFAWLCSYASFAGQPEQFETSFPSLVADPARTNQQIELFWLGVGSEDFLYPNAKLFMDKLEQNGIRTVTRISGGGHTWMNARDYLEESAKQLFK